MNPAAQFRGVAPERSSQTQTGLRNEFVVKGDEAERHSEGPVARKIEEYTAQLPSDTYLWAAGASIAASITLMMAGNKHGSLFVGQWAPTFLILGLYNKIVKVAGSDRVHAG
jgi:hypothetical protein